MQPVLYFSTDETKTYTTKENFHQTTQRRYSIIEYGFRFIVNPDSDFF